MWKRAQTFFRISRFRGVQTLAWPLHFSFPLIKNEKFSFPDHKTKTKKRKKRNLQSKVDPTVTEWIINLTFGEIRGKKRRNFFLNEENNSGGSENMAVFTLVFSLSQIWNLSDYSPLQRTTNLSPRHINGSAHITLWWLSDIFFSPSALFYASCVVTIFEGNGFRGSILGFSLLPLMPPKTDWIWCFFSTRAGFEYFPLVVSTNLWPRPFS